MVALTIEGAEVCVFIFMRTWVSTLASEVPTDADNLVIGTEEIVGGVF